MSFIEKIKSELDSLREQDQFRVLRNQDKNAGLLNLSSNDYLGLAAMPGLQEEFYQGVINDPRSEAFALSSSSSRLLTGNHPAYTQLEDTLSDMYQGSKALVFNSGYHANIGILPALSSKGDLILSDKLNHASIIDGLRLSDAQFKRYPHLDYDSLERSLSSACGKYENIFIITESVFSMDGDLADLRKLVELKEKYNAVLIVDEAHSVGIFGEKGCGLAEAEGVIDKVDVIVGTFGKAFCSAGAYAVMDTAVKEYLINKMRSLIFTTALPPVVVSWSNFVLNKTSHMTERRENVLKLAEKLREGLRSAGFQTDGKSQIVPLIVGENAKAVALSEKLRNAGLLVFAIRPPTVPVGTARLRFSLTGALHEKDIDKLLSIL
jgi:8-amino-7-oxononanoate synthase